MSCINFDKATKEELIMWLDKNYYNRFTVNNYYDVYHNTLVKFNLTYPLFKREHRT